MATRPHKRAIPAGFFSDAIKAKVPASTIESKIEAEPQRTVVFKQPQVPIIRSVDLDHQMLLFEQEIYPNRSGKIPPEAIIEPEVPKIVDEQAEEDDDLERQDLEEAHLQKRLGKRLERLQSKRKSCLVNSLSEPPSVTTVNISKSQVPLQSKTRGKRMKNYFDDESEED